MQSNSSKRKNIFTLSVLICLFLTLRLAVLFSSLDKIYDSEELYQGTIAREIIRGPLISLWEYLDYKVEYFSGGVLTAGIMAVPFFLLFGQIYISLKLVGLSVTLATFILWYIFFDKFFSRSTAVICALLFIFCMPFYTKMSLRTWGQHSEHNFFTILSIFIFYLIFFKADKRQENNISGFYKSNVKYFFLLGLIAGLGLWFIYTYLLTIVFLFLFWFIFDKKFFLREVFCIYCFGFLIGFSPAIYYEIFHKGAVFLINGQSIFSAMRSSSLGNVLPKLFSLFSYDFPRAFLFESFLNIDRIWLSYLYYFVFVIAFVYLLWINKRDILILFKNLIYPITLKEVKVLPSDISKELLILIYPLFFFFAYSLSNFSVSPLGWDSHEVYLDYIAYRYMIPVMPLIFVIISMFITHIGTRSVLFRIFLPLVLILGLIGNLNLISLKNFGRFYHDKGYSYNIIGDKIGLRVTHNLAEYIKPFDRLDPDLKIQFYEGLGAGIGWRLRNEDIDKVIKITETQIKPEYRTYIYRGWGALFTLQYPEEYNRALYIAKNIPFRYRPSFYEGVGRNRNFIDDIEAAIKFINDIDKRIDKIYQPFFYIGLGNNIGFKFKAEPDKMLSLLSRIDQKYRKFAYQGLYSGMRER